MKFLRTVLAGTAFALLLAIPSAAQGLSVDLYVAKPLANGTVTITVTNNGVSQSTSVAILGTDSVTQKKDKIYNALSANGYSVLRWWGSGRGHAISISNLPNGATVTFDPGTTGENADQLIARPARGGRLSYSGAFSPLGADGQPVRFTAGVVAPGGEVRVEYIAEDAWSDKAIPGSYVANRLYDLLAPAAASLGATLTLSGDGIDVALGSTGETGLIWGTTSPNEGVSATLAAEDDAAPPPNPQPDPTTCPPLTDVK